MASLGRCGDWLVFACGTRLVAVHREDKDREPFVFDCSHAEKRIRRREEDSHSDGDPSEDTGSDRVLAFAASPSGKLLALTDDSKRIVLCGCEPTWHCLSVRWVARRCTSLVFSQMEDELLVADKSGDVYSFSVLEEQKEGELKMGHLSMLLCVTLSPDNRFIITADRDEKIRVSLLRSPHNIQAFCLGHRQFVSALHIPSGHPEWLLSGSGDGTVKLWQFESGHQLQSRELHQQEEMNSSEQDQNPTVCRITSSPGGHHVAVQCEGLSTVQFYTLEEGEEKLVTHSHLTLPHPPLDMTFDPEGRLWVLLDSREAPLQMYSLTGSVWECPSQSPELQRVTKALRPHWETLEATARTSERLQHLHKSSFDNMAVYLQKKQQRMNEQELKRSLTQKSGGHKKSRGEGRRETR